VTSPCRNWGFIPQITHVIKERPVPKYKPNRNAEVMFHTGHAHLGEPITKFHKDDAHLAEFLFLRFHYAFRFYTQDHLSDKHPY
uniref:Uncharacterized protein n=1 Tax=Esox lucius TaxID=8010 RepID=A0AAY5K3A0_ESOLU